MDKIKVLVSMLEENVEMMENHPKRKKEWREQMDKYKEKHGDTRYFYEPCPVLGTSKTHIRDIAKLIRKELLKI